MTPDYRRFEPALPDSKLIDEAGKRILVISATDWRRLAAHVDKSPGTLFAKAFEDAANCDAIILDLRNKRENSGIGLRTEIAPLLKTDIPLPAGRSRFDRGYAYQDVQNSANNYAGPYYSGLVTSEQAMLTAKPGPSAGKRLIVLASAATDVDTSVLAALQASGQAVVIHNSSDFSSFTAEEYGYGMDAGDRVWVNIRTEDYINSDGTAGLAPNLIVDKVQPQNDDPVFRAALSLARNEMQAPPPSARRAAGSPLRPRENPYPEMASPNREYRLLGLFRVWNVMHYFFPYKHHMDRSWDAVLTEFIPRFADGSTATEYGLTAREFTAHLQDSHVTVSGKLIGVAQMDRFGRGLPIRCRAVRGEFVVVAADASVRDQIQVGDVVLAVDDEPLTERRTSLAKYFSASTPQSLNWVLGWQYSLLFCGQAEAAILKVRDPIGMVRNARLPRQPGTAAISQQLTKDVERKTPVYSVLPEGYGYFDLERLEQKQVDAAYEKVKDTAALILDMRGYPRGTAFPICARLTDKPVHSAAFYAPYWTSPEGPAPRLAFQQMIEPSPLWKYTNPVVVLINDAAASQSEWLCQCVEQAAKGRVTFLGTPTQGVNNEVTNTSMPGGIRVQFTGQEVRHADGRQLQRVGIQPDIRVEPTIAGLAAGQDEVLAAAIKFLNEKKGD